MALGSRVRRGLYRIAQYTKQGNAENGENKLSKKEWQHEGDQGKWETHKKELKEAIKKKCW